MRQNANSHGEWRSLVAHSAGGRAVAGSNPVSPIQRLGSHSRDKPASPRTFANSVDYPLKGPAYLRSSTHELPDLVIALHGPPSQPIEIDADGGSTRSTEACGCDSRSPRRAPRQSGKVA